MSNYWIELAQAKWPNAAVHSSGRFALATVKNKVVTAVYLFEREPEARLNSTFYDSRVWDLRPTPVPTKCTDIGYDREERRREREERNQ